MSTKPIDDPRLASLRRKQRALHRRPETVQDEVFRSDGFFDPRDLVQVRYEMLRRHRIDGKAVSDVAHSFGVSRQAFYVTDASFREPAAFPGCFRGGAARGVPISVRTRSWISWSSWVPATARRPLSKPSGVASA